MPLFATLEKPLIVAVCVANDARTTVESAVRSIAAGADLVEVNVAQLSDAEIFKLDLPPELPCYVVCRRRKFMSVYGLEWRALPERHDEARMLLLSSLIDSGAQGFDMECDTFADGSGVIPEPLPAELQELSVGETPVRLQMDLINACRARNAEVILSCHSGTALTTAQTLALAGLMAGRGAGVIKIVNSHQDATYCGEALNAIIRMRETISIPFLVTSVGPFSNVLRMAGCYLGNSYVFCRAEGQSAFYPDHPPIAHVRELWRLFPANFEGTHV
ncbi:MAG TPA: type I 3-dehydroquinate dehydratase [Pyrinomonadaceae bacterium]|nr:type I 3-dehydroquinate dehydratase [Pyrinomonadaceae bacterium]